MSYVSNTEMRGGVSKQARKQARGHAPEPLPSLYPTHLLPLPDAQRLKLICNGEEDGILGIYTKVAAEVEGAINGDVVISAIWIKGVVL